MSRFRAAFRRLAFASAAVAAAAAALAAGAEPDAAPPPDDGREEVEAALVAAFDGEPPALMLRYARILERAGETASARSWARRVLGAREGLSEADRGEADALAERLGLGPGDAAPPPAVRWRGLEESAASPRPRGGPPGSRLRRRPGPGCR